jgi:hypothetical protein
MNKTAAPLVMSAGQRESLAVLARSSSSVESDAKASTTVRPKIPAHATRAS